MEKNIMERDGTVLQCLELPPHRVLRFDCRPSGPFCVKLACSSCVGAGSFPGTQVYSLSPKMHVKLVFFRF